MPRVTIVLDVEVTNPRQFAIAAARSDDPDWKPMTVADVVANALPQIDWNGLGLTAEYVDHH